MIEKLTSDWYAIENIQYKNVEYIDFLKWLSASSHEKRIIFPHYHFKFTDNESEGEFHNRWGHLLNWSQYESV